jgi:hypothetical protein
MTKETATLLDLEAMANETLDAIPEAPDYSNPPAGEYRLSCQDAKIDKYKTKEKQGQPSVEAQRLKITYSILETKSTAEGEQPVPNGTLFTETFQGTEQGLSYFKKRIREIMNVEETTGVTLGDMMASVKGTEFNCRISIRKSPNPAKPGEFYENVQIRIVPATK